MPRQKSALCLRPLSGLVLRGLLLPIKLVTGRRTSIQSHGRRCLNVILRSPGYRLFERLVREIGTGAAVCEEERHGGAWVEIIFIGAR